MTSSAAEIMRPAGPGIDSKGFVEAQALLRVLIAELAAYDWASVPEDVLGAVFERMIPRSEQILLGQFYTPRPVADLLVALTLAGERPTVLDPGCGSGTFLMSAYAYLAARRQLSHRDLLATLWGFDVNPVAAQLAAINLYRQDLGELDVSPRIAVGNFFGREPGQPIDVPPPRTAVPIPHFDCVLGNPPYLRSQQQDDLDPEYRKQLFAAASRAHVKAEAKTDLFGFFIYHALRFMKVGSRLGFVTPASWLTSNYAAALQILLTGELRLAALVCSVAESFLPRAEIHTVLLVAERVDATAEAGDAVLRFVALKRPIAALTAGPGAYWDRVVELADAILAHRTSHEDDRMRVHAVPLATEQAALRADPTTPRNWSRYLRAPASFSRLAGDPAFTTLGEVARVSLGYKSLQNEFYYVDQATVDAYAIEPRFLRPIFMLGDLDGGVFLQAPTQAQRLFLCRDSEEDLRGTGALRYIHAMAGRPTAKRKQSGAQGTIREVLTAQGGGLWYGPKARPHAAHVWLRKAFDTVYAPLLFDPAGVVDQRCNYLEPAEGLSWALVAAALTSTTFALSIEISGSASMGGGALEAPTTKLRGYPVFDPRRLDARAQATFVGMARAVWAGESPVDWGLAHGGPGPLLRALDRWVLDRTSTAGSAERWPLDHLYDDLRETCRLRTGVARTRTTQHPTARTR